MKVLFVNISDVRGGAALGSYRLHEEVLKRGFTSRMLVGEAVSKSKLVDQLPKTYLDKALRPLATFIGLNYVNVLSSFHTVTSHPFYIEADVLNLHCLHKGFFNYLAIPKITRDKPTIYKLSDMWSFTGHCAYSLDCDKWKIGCGKCPYPSTYPSIRRDSTHLEWKLKENIYNNSNLRIVVPSKWLKDTTRKSILGDFEITFIPNGINVNNYFPIPKEIARQVVGIPKNKYAILFVAQNLDDPRKGGDLFVKALEHLPSSLKNDLVILCLGTGGDIIRQSIDLPLIDLGYVSGDRLKALVYSSADVFVFPTRADIFGLVLLESIACGTPVVSFDVTAVPELVRPSITGLLAKPEDPNDLAAKIIESLEDNSLRVQMSQNCREIALAEYSIELQADRYISLYRQVIDAF